MKKFLLILVVFSSLRADDDISSFSKTLRDLVFLRLYNDPIDIAAIEYHENYLTKTFQREFEEGRLTLFTEQVPVDGHDFTLKVFECTTPEAEEFHTLFYACGGCDDLHTADSKIDAYLHAYFDQKQTKNLRVIVFSYYETHLLEEERWMPRDKDAMARPPIEILKKLHTKGQHVDTLVWFSMGGVLCEALPTLDFEGDLSWLPSLFVSDRGLSSIWKVGWRLINPAFYHTFYYGAYLTNWHSDPESRLLEFFDKMNGHPHTPELAIIEVHTDSYFSSDTRFEPGFENQVNTTCYRGYFTAPDTPFHMRSHHNLPLHTIPVLPSADRDDFIPTVLYESVAHALLRYALQPDNTL